MYIITYHYVRDLTDSRYPGIKGLDLKYFESQLNYLQNNGFNFVTVQDIINNENIDEKSTLLTFDDGYIDHYTNVFPLLNKYGIQGVFSMPAKILAEKKVLDVNKIHFVLAVGNLDEIKHRLMDRMDFYRGNEWDYPPNDELYHEYAKKNRFDDEDTIFVKRVLQTALPEKVRNIITDELFKYFVTENESSFVNELYMSLEQVKTMKRNGMEFAYHGYDHYWMNHLDEKLLTSDIEKALDFFDGIIPKNWVCCYPYGSHSDSVILKIKEMGAVIGLSAKVGTFVHGRDDLFKMPRFDTNDLPPKSNEFKKYIK